MKSTYSDEGRFDFFLNKTIILSSKKYFKKQANKYDYEQNINDNESIDSLLLDFAFQNNITNDIERLELKLELESYKDCLSQVEQMVLFLLYNKDLSQEEAAKILNMYSQAVNRIKMRAISKLRDIMKKRDDKNEE